MPLARHLFAITRHLFVLLTLCDTAHNTPGTICQHTLNNLSPTLPPMPFASPLALLTSVQHRSLFDLIQMSSIVRRDWSALEYASDEMRGDREVVLVAVRKAGRYLVTVSDKIKGEQRVHSGSRAKRCEGT